MNWNQALKKYYQMNKPECYVPRKGSKHYAGVVALMSGKKPAKTTATRKAPAKRKTPVKAPTTRKKPARKVSKTGNLTKKQCNDIKKALGIIRNR